MDATSLSKAEIAELKNGLQPIERLLEDLLRQTELCSGSKRPLASEAAATPADVPGLTSRVVKGDQGQPLTSLRVAKRSPFPIRLV